MQCSSASNNAKRTNETGLAHTEGPECKKAKNKDNVFFTIALNVNGVQQQVEFYAKVIRCDDPDTYKYSIRSNNTICAEYLSFITREVLLKAQIEIDDDQIDATYNIPKEIYNNHIQQTNEIAQDATQKIETCKNIKKNTNEFIKLAKETKKPLFVQLTCKKRKYEKIDKLNDYLKTKSKYTRKKFMEQDVIKTLNLAKYLPVCLTKYTCNKEIFDEQTEAIRNEFNTGLIDFDKFYNILDKEIDYDDDDKEMLAKLVDKQMNDFLHKNINSLTLLFPKMQFFMEYYNKFQDNLVFFVDMKHVCMVYGMMHVLETILKCTEHMVKDIKDINNKMIDCSNINQTYLHYGINFTIIYYLVTKFEIEKMLLYILQSFIPTDHFIDLVNVFHIEYICSLSVFIFVKDNLCIQKSKITESAILQMLMYCYIHFDALETDESGTQKNVTYLFFKYFIDEKFEMNFLPSWYLSLDLKDLLIRNNCLSIYILNNADKLCDNLKEIYDTLVLIHNHMQNMAPPDKKKKENKNILQTIKKNSESNKIVNEYKKNNNYKLKRRLEYKTYNNQITKFTNFYAIVFFIFNCMCNSIIASESTFIMSYNITCNKNEIKDVIDYFMEIVENWNDTSYKQKKPIDYDLTFSKPKFLKGKKVKK
ncbi:hypothetical protein BDAP_000947 [Binucleata daphniae]